MMGFLKWERHMQVFVGFVLIFTVPFCVGLTDLEDVMAINGLYVALGYPPLQGWLLVGGDPCGDKWEGVEYVFSNITSIKLSNAQLGGGLGESLQFFGLVIEMNQPTRSIPPSLSSLTQLLDLSLANNFLVGPILDAFQQYASLANLEQFKWSSSSINGKSVIFVDIALAEQSANWSSRCLTGSSATGFVLFMHPCHAFFFCNFCIRGTNIYLKIVE